MWQELVLTDINNNLEKTLYRCLCSVIVASVLVALPVTNLKMACHQFPDARFYSKRSIGMLLGS